MRTRASFFDVFEVYKSCTMSSNFSRTERLYKRGRENCSTLDSYEGREDAQNDVIISACDDG